MNTNSVNFQEQVKNAVLDEMKNTRMRVRPKPRVTLNAGCGGGGGCGREKVNMH